MADLDQLAIHIGAESKRADEAIDGLIRRLRTLNTSLNLGNINNFTRQLSQITSAAKGLNDVAASIRSVANAGSSLSKLTGFKTQTDELREYEKAVQQITTSISKQFNFKLAKPQEYAASVRDIKDMTESTFRALQKGKFTPDELFGGTADVFNQLIPLMARYKKDVSGFDEDVASFAKNTKIYIDESTKSWLQYKGVLGDVKKAFRDVSFESKAGYVDIDESQFISDLQNIGITAESSEERLEKILSSVKRYKEQLKDAVQEGIDPHMDGTENIGAEIVQQIIDAHNRIKQSADEVKNPFEGVTEGLKSLQDVTIPDFSGLDVLSSGLERLTKINPDKVAKIVDALKGTGEISVAGVGDSVANMAQTVDNVLSELSKEGNPANFIVDELGKIATLNIDKPFKTVVDELRNAGNAADFVVDKSGNIARIADEVAQSVHGVAQGFELAVRLPQELATGFGFILEDAENLKQIVDETADGLQGSFGGAMSEMSNQFDIVLRDTYALKEAFDTLDGDIENPFDGWDNSIENLKDVWNDIQDSLVVDADNFDIKQFFTVAPLDEFSKHLHDVIMNMEKYESILAGMKEHPATFDAEGYKDIAKKLHDAKIEWEDFEKEVTEHIKFADVDYSSLDDVSKRLTELIDQKKEYDRIISSMESGQVVTNAQLLEQAYKGSAETAKEIEKLEQSLGKASNKTKEVSKSSIDLLANLVALGHEINNVANAFDKLGDDGIKALRWIYKPVEIAANEYKERLSGLVNTFKNFADGAKKHIDNLARFWKRSMKTFTFMLVRKAITQAMNELNDATESLAKWSKQFGTIFNDSMSQITSNFSYIARSIIGAFEPIINAIVPAFNMLSDAIVNVSAKLAEFFAAMTGQSYYMVAKRQVTDYADSVDKANKAQKNLISGLDDLNVITTPTSTASGMDDLAAQWEKVDVSGKAKDWADKVKDLARTLFDPIKKAWDEAGDHVVDGFKYMVSEIAKLGKSIGRDFMKVWAEPETQQIFENILHTIGYIEEGIGNLAKRFREAWDENDKGLHILQNIRDIVLIITEHVKNMARTFRDWADDLDFNPLLDAFEQFTEALKPLTDFIMGVIEDIWERIVLRHWKWEIETGIPHLLLTIKEIIDSFDLQKIRRDLQPVEDAFETMRENIETGIVNAIGNLGKRIAEFANSQAFTDFTANIAWFMEQITAERVEKLFKALGDAVLNVAEALMRFVGSDTFKDFMQKLLDWYDSLSTEDIAGFITRIAVAIAAFKFTAFVGKGLSKFFEFISVLQSIKGIGSLGGIFEGLSAGTFGTMALAIAGVSLAVYSLIESFGGLKGTLEELKKHFDLVKDAIGKVFDRIGMSDSIKRLKDAFKGLLDVLGNQKSTWQVLLGLLDAVFVLVANVGIPVIKFSIDLATSFIEAISGVLDVVGGLFDLLKGFFTGDSDLIAEGWTRMCGGIREAAQGLFDFLAAPGALFQSLVEGIAGFFSWLKNVLIGDPIVLDIVDGVIRAFSDMVKGVIEFVGGLVGDIAGFFTDIKDKVIEIATNIKDGAVELFGNLRDGVVEKWNDMIGDADKKWTKIKDTVSGLAEDLRDGLQKTWDNLKAEASQAWEDFKTGANEKWDKIRTTIHDIASDLKRKLKSRWDDIKREGSQAWTQFKADAEEKWNKIRDTIHNIAIDLGNKLAAKWSEIKSTASNWWDQTKSAADSTWNNIKDTIIGKVSEAVGTLPAKWDEMKRGAEDAFWSVVNSAGSILSNMRNTVQNAFNNAGDWLKSAGSNIVQGLADGITNAKSTVTNAFDKVTGWGSQRFTSSAYGWGIHSPSTLTTEWGEYIDEGLALGIEKSANMPATAMLKMAEQAQQAFLNNQLNYWEVAENQMSDFSSAIMAQVNRVSSAMESVASNSMNALRGAFNGVQEIGANVIDGLVNGISRKLGAVMDAIRNVAQGMIKTFTGILQINSPSKVFRQFGEYTVDGFNNGIENMSSSTEKAVSKWLDGAMNIDLPKWDIEAAIPKSNIRTDSYTHTDVSGMMELDNAAIQEGVRQGVAEAVGSLILPYLSEISESSRETANKKFGITSRDAFNAVRTEAQSYKRQTGKPAFGY